MNDKTLTDTEMMIFALSFQHRREMLRNHVNIDENKKVLIAYENAIFDATSIRKSEKYLRKTFSQFGTNGREIEVLKKVLGLPPEE